MPATDGLHFPNPKHPKNVGISETLSVQTAAPLLHTRFLSAIKGVIVSRS